MEIRFEKEKQKGSRKMKVHRMRKRFRLTEELSKRDRQKSYRDDDPAALF